MDNFKKVYRIGNRTAYGERSFPVFVKAEYTDGKLSMTGVEDPKRNGDAVGACGQICMYPTWDQYAPAPGWTAESIARLFEIWDEWHLNDMQAGCVHQRANWDALAKVLVTEYTWSVKYHQMSKRAGNGELTDQEYADFAPISQRVLAATIGSKTPKYASPEIAVLLDEGWIKAGKTEVKTAGWVHPEEHPEGLLMKPCEVCGYEYGSSWLKQDVPESILQELKDFPDTDREPAWI
jgi:hypothetical protein